MPLENHILGLSKSKTIENLLWCLAKLRTRMSFWEEMERIQFSGKKTLSYLL